MKKLLGLVAALALLAAVAVPALAATRTVKVDDNVFSPKSLSVRKGDSVRFRWVGRAPHNVARSSGPSFSTIGIRRSGTVTRRLRRRGTYRLVCTIHPGMSMKVVVR